MGKMIGAAEFKAHCLRILRDVGRTGEDVTVTHRGVPVAKVVPIGPEPKVPRKLFFGCMKGQIQILGDIVSSPLDPDWEEQWEKKWDERGFTKR
jgi:prevent-host-death family protein